MKKKKFRINIQAQHFDYEKKSDAFEQVKRLMDCHLWYMELEEVKK